MRRATTGLWPLLLLVGVAASSAGQNPPASADAQKLEAAWTFLRARNARDYAVATPNGIDEPGTSRSAASSSGSRFAEKTETTQC